MDWARDGSGNLVHASEWAHRGWYACPCCDQRVHLRAGVLRTAYFAHNSHLADPACENYHPSVYDRIAVSGGAATRTPNPYAEHFQCGVLLERDELSWRLQLRLPRLPEGSAESGRLWIATAIGERPPYSTLNLRRRQRVPLVPALPLATVRGEGGLAPWAQILTACLGDFAATGNFFRAGERGGRLMPRDAVLEWGGRYRVLTRDAWVAPLPEGLTVEALQGARDWHGYEVTLPPDGTLETDRAAALFRFLGRRIEPPVGHAWFIDPAPHHYDNDGTAVFPESVGVILLRVTGSGGVRVVSLADGNDLGMVRDPDGGWCELDKLEPGEFMVLIDGAPALFGNIEANLSPFLPDGVRLRQGKLECEIFEGEANPRGDGGQLQVVCPSERVAAFLGLPAAQWTLSERIYERQGEWPEIINAGNFGVLHCEPERAEPEESVEAEAWPERNFWLEGVLARYATATGNGPGQPDWLLPHIRHLTNGEITK